MRNLVLAYQNNIGSSDLISEALTIVQHQNRDIYFKQRVLSIAAKHNLCQSVDVLFSSEEINQKNLVSSMLLYQILTNNDQYISLCNQIEHQSIHAQYYLNYFTNKVFKRQPFDTKKSFYQQQYEKQIKEPFETEKIIGLYQVDFYLPQSNKVIEVNGYSHYHNQGERRTGIYQQKCNYLLKNNYLLEEVRQF
ncbi:hypothetical protein pb186bvf_012168 [Paramecium bursaria]